MQPWISGRWLATKATARSFKSLASIVNYLRMLSGVVLCYVRSEVCGLGASF